MFGWYMDLQYYNEQSRVTRLAPNFAPNRALGIVSGYPLFSVWARPIVAFADVNHNGRIDATEYVVGDSLEYVGHPEPTYQLDMSTGITLLEGRLSLHGTFAYQHGMTQNNLTATQSAGVELLPNDPTLSLGTQAALVAAFCSRAPDNGNLFGCAPTPIGMIQQVNTFRFNDVSVNYTLPRLVSQWLHVPRSTLALQGSNLALHSNYRGKDPNVNAFSTAQGGDVTADLGQIPEPRAWRLTLNLGN
jgi:hypothetical protein